MDPVVTPERARRLARVLISDVAAYAGDQVRIGLEKDDLFERLAPDPTGQRLWLIHELLFTGVALWLRTRWLPARVQDPVRLRFLRRVCSYVILYYALWAGCDALWMTTSLDAAWLLRAIPNQLYYAFFVPFAWLAWTRRPLRPPLGLPIR